MASKFLYQDESPESRIRSLQNTADNVIKSKKFFKKLTAGELTDKRKEFTDNSLEAFDLEEEKKELIKQFKAKIDPIKDYVKIVGQEIRTGHAMQEGNLYGFVDVETRLVYFYSESGELIETETRAANQDELGLFSNMRVLKTGTDE